MKQALAHLRASDPILGAIIDRVGPFRMKYGSAEFASLLRAIVGQQLSTKAASTIYGRLAEACDGKVVPLAIEGLPDERLRGLGLSPQKLRYVRDLSARTLSGELDFSRLNELPDDEVLARLTAVKGVGVWTAQMFMMFALRRPDVYFPVADLGLRNAIHRVYRLKQPPKPDKMLKIAACWRPYTSIACWYLWRSLDGEAAL